MTTSEITVRPVRTLRDRQRFVDLPFRLFGHDPDFVPPLRLNVYDRISRRHPATAHEVSALWLAWREGRPVGRIGACVDRLFNEFQASAWAWVGFFESVDDPAVARALFEQAQRWARAQEARTCVGPASFTTNDECGLLLDSKAGEAPMVLTTQNPSYYETLWTGAGWKPARDLLAWRLEPATARLSERQQRALQYARDHTSLRVRAMRRADFAAEVDRFFAVYNSAWERNWGFAPATEPEIRHIAQALKYVIDMELALVAETASGEPVAVALVLPDLNEALRRERSGRLFPTAWWRLLRAPRRVTGVRIYALGARREYEASGVALMLYQELFERIRARPRVRTVEASWILDTNAGMNRALAAMGATVSRRWRMYECEL